MSTVQTLAEHWLDLKAAERDATKRRVAVEEQIIAAIGARDEGAKTTKVGDFSITITGKMSYKCADIYTLADRCPEVVKPALNETALKHLREEMPARYAAIADLIEVKPAKTAVEIKVTA